MIDRLIGNTPLVKLERVIEPEFEVWVKLEGQNPGGSIKDRTALAMVLDAEQRGLLKPGGTIIEPTSGNTGIGLAQVAAARGYRLILCLPAQMSEELVLTDPKRRMLAAIEEAKKLVSCTPNAWMPNQFENAANPRVHYETTGPELWKQMDGKIDAFVYGTGTGGTISGVGKYLKEQNPNVQIIGIEPARSNVLSGGTRGEHGFQGMGPGFIPPNLERDLLDRVLMIWEEDAFPFARRLAREEGLFIGMSSGANIYAATQVARMLGPGKRIATIACDTGARYLSTKLFLEP
jgi:cysteine synthase